MKDDNIKNEILKRLFDLQDLKYRDFMCKLIPKINPKKVIGIRTPIIRKFSKKLYKDSCYNEFLKSLPHEYYEENNLHGFIIENIMDYEKLINELDRFLPYVDNWATCDLISPKILKNHLPKFIKKIKIWIKSSNIYTVRFGIRMLMNFYLDEYFDAKYLEWVAGIESEEYYVNMMISWYFATALAKRYADSILYIENGKLNKWVNNKTIQKANESLRISDDKKKYLKKFKRV